MNLDLLEKILHPHPAFRRAQAYKAVFGDLVEGWDEATSLPKELREELKRECPLEIRARILTSKDGQSQKAAIELDNRANVNVGVQNFEPLHSHSSRAAKAERGGDVIETVLLRYEGRNTVCVSTQVGCAMGCEYCATGQMGFTRDLTAMEMAEQVLLFARALKKENQRVSSIVFMGMGEPFLNYDNVMAAADIFHDQNGFNIGWRHISISTCGIVPGIKKFADDKRQINLAISLNAPNDVLRTKLMAVNKSYPIKKVLAAVDEYIAKTNRKVMFEYLMIAGENDSIAQAEELARLMKKPLYMVNLIPYNFTGKFKSSSNAQIHAFRDVLVRAGIYVTQRKRFGRGIRAACGQLVSAKSKGQS